MAPQIDPLLKYASRNGFTSLFDNPGMQHERTVFDAVNGLRDSPISVNITDLARLHQLVRRRCCFTVLEFGVGFSTVVFADAVRRNEAEWQRLSGTPEIRNRFMFQLFSVDASQKWIDHTRERMPEHLADRVTFHHSPVEIGTYRDQLCHYYKQLPDVVADFIYLDGPSPQDVQSDVHGMTFQCPERTVMSGDLLLMEPTLLPGTMILVDGRTNNARFLERNFTRPFRTDWDRDGDVTTFELAEERLGKYNVLGNDFLSENRPLNSVD